jgi:hypothetical protein
MNKLIIVVLALHSGTWSMHGCSVCWFVHAGIRMLRSPPQNALVPHAMRAGGTDDRVALLAAACTTGRLSPSCPLARGVDSPALLF